MLKKCGMTSLDDLYSDVPKALQYDKPYDVPEAYTEEELRAQFNKAETPDSSTPLLGAGFYYHGAPAVCKNIISRSEFLTAYTPYQAEISQGTLQYIFEFQSMMTELTGMEVSNASMYDGTTATAEAMMMAVAAAKKRNRVLISATVNPIVRNVAKTYAWAHDVTLDVIPETKDGDTDLKALKKELEKDDVAGVIVATPNFYGILEDYSGVADLCHEHKALLIMNCIAGALPVIKSPGEWGADIAVGDGQSLGVPLNFGGPYVGFLCTSKKLIRKMPGRIVGATTDADGKRAFVLTLQAREQHIRREKATSNICSNQSLMALYVTTYLSAMGPKGMQRINDLCCDNAHRLADELCTLPGVSLAYPNRPFLNEFVIKFKDGIPSEFDGQFGYRLDDNRLLIYTHEDFTPDRSAEFVQILKFILSNDPEPKPKARKS